MREWMQSRAAPIIGLGVAALIAGCAGSGATRAKPSPPKVLRLTHQLGGTHYRTVVHGDVWYQTFGSWLLVLDREGGNAIKTIELGPPGETGPAIDLLVHEPEGRPPSMFVVIEDDAVIELSLESPQAPARTRSMSAAELGIRPRRLSSVGQSVYVAGGGGIVRLDDGDVAVGGENQAGAVVKSSQGLVAVVDGQVRRIIDDRFVGWAHELVAIPEDVIATMPAESDDVAALRPGLVFLKQSERAAIVGLMSDDLRELEGPKSKIAATGTVRRARFAGGKLWVVTDQSITSYSLGPDSVTEALRIDVLGARDLDLLNDAELAIAGAFGRAIYRFRPDERGPAGALRAEHREPGGLTRATTDGQHILAGGRGGGLWMYLINARVELTARSFDTPPSPPPRRAATVSAQAQISDDGTAVTVTRAGQPAMTHQEPDGCRIHCVAAVDGDFWLGHDRGITALALSEGRKNARVRIAGPVLYIYPLLIGGGASYVSESGGFGVVEWVDDTSVARSN